jgi:UDP-glucose:tetrahydrobiopterin glucosyltransferase
MKVLLVSGSDILLKEPYNSGIEAFMVSLANQLIDEGHNVHVVDEEAEPNPNFTLINPFQASPLRQPEHDKISEERISLKD